MNFYTIQTPCKFGTNCNRRDDPFHLEKYSHQPELTDSDDDSTSTCEDMQTPCKFGTNCNRRDDPFHLEKYFHQPELSDSDNDYQLTCQNKQIPCRYGINCYNNNPSHLKEYSHPQKPKDCDKNFPPSNETQPRCKYGAGCYRKKPAHFKKYFHPHKNAQSKAEGVLPIKYNTPVYWGKNALSESYLEINVNPNSSEFRIIRDLLNNTVGQHGNRWGTIYGRDPAEFIITKLTRVHNKDLWQEYSFKKKRIMKNNNKQLENSESSKYLQGCPLLVPLLDARANEYWLFHGSDSKILPTLLKTGYDPRVSNVDGMFGGGFYLAENSSKSNQYIPCPGCAQNCILREPQCKCNNQEDFEFSIILYRTILGDVHIVKQYKKDIYRGIDKHHPVRRPPKKQNSEELYDSVMGECKKYGGDRLNYREFIIYDGGQAYPEYVIQFKRSTERTNSRCDLKHVIDKCHMFLTTDSS